jgi:protein SCO1/2
VVNPPRTLADFSLASTTGETFTLSEHQGQIILLYFGYRTCPDICPTTFSTMKRVYQELGEPADKVKVVFVTVDPERDTLENMTLYTSAFHDDFIGLRDDGEPLKQIMSEFGVVATRRKVGESALSYLIDHTASVFLIGADGKLLAQYLYGTDYRDYVHDVKLLLTEL